MRTAGFVLLSTAFTAAAFAQDAVDQKIAGVWQGTMQAQSALRIVAQISRGDGAAFKAVLYSIDQSNQGMASSSMILQDGTVKIIVPGIGGGYEGKLNTAGNQMTGTFHQGNLALPLNLAKATAATAWAIPTAPPPAAKAMTAGADPAFEVATIKPSKPGTPGLGIGVKGRTVSTVNTPLSMLVAFAYGVQAKQIVGGPAWLETEKFDITAEPDTQGVPNSKQLRTMVQKLLADRFQLKFHRDKKELSVYALSVLKTGNKLAPSTADPNGLPGVGFGSLGRLAARNAMMSDFIGVMETTVLDRPVIDQTGLTGHYDFTLSWKPDEFQFADLRGSLPPGADPSNADLPDLYTAIQQQLGMKLEATQASAEVLIIDRIEKPSQN